MLDFQLIKLRFILLVLPLFVGVKSWKRSALVYHLENRNLESWKRHIMRVDNMGLFTGQWLFDAAVLTTHSINGKDIYSGQGPSNTYLTESDLNDLLNQLFSDATALDRVISSLSQQYASPASLPLHIFIGVPYFHPQNKELVLSGQTYDLSQPSQRLSATKWYLDKIKTEERSAQWRYFQFGVYYHREDILIHFNDADYVRSLNDYAHQLQFNSVWIPYYDAPYAWNGSDLGFDNVVIQPRYSFLSSIDGGILKGDRLYGTGYKARGQNQCFEYELRSNGESDEEHFIAHQYLAISQYTNCWQYPQAFFVGPAAAGYNDLFDSVTGQSSVFGRVWDSYTDLANYLRGDQILNMEVGISGFREINSTLWEASWTSNDYSENLNSIRLDFRDYDDLKPWRGRLSVLVGGERRRSSYAVRIGTDHVNQEYNSVFVPLSNEAVMSGTTLLIQLIREDGSPWPNVILLVAAKYEPKLIANPVAYSIAQSSITVAAQNYLDSQPTESRYSAGKLTDGRVSSDSWYWSGVVGWKQIERRITVTIDLGIITDIAAVQVLTWQSFEASIFWPTRAEALIASDCEPQERGTLYGCIPSASSGSSKLEVQGLCGPFCSKGAITTTFGDGSRGRFVTLSMVAISWLMVDEVQVLDRSGRVISTGASYRITPAPGEYSYGQNAYPSNSQSLADGSVFREFIYGRNVVGINQPSPATVEIQWVKPLENVTRGVIWMTDVKPSYGIGLPSAVKMQWRNENFIWQFATPVQVTTCTTYPCATLSLPVGSKITGLRGTISSNGIWTMVSEMSVM